MSKTRTIATAWALLLACTWATALAQKKRAYRQGGTALQGNAACEHQGGVVADFDQGEGC